MSISGISKLAETLAATVSASFSKTSHNATGRPVTRTRSDVSDQSPALADRFRSRCTSVDNTDPDRRRKLFRLFIELALAEQLGNQLMNDPDFAAMTDKVADAMLAESALAADVDAILQLASIQR